MAFVKCGKCGKSYSDKFPECPFCNKSEQTLNGVLKKPVNPWGVVIGVIITVIVICSYEYKKHQEAKEEKQRIELARKEKEEKRQEREERRKEYKAQKLAEKQKKESDPTFIKYGEAPTISYDGRTCFEVERYLQRILNDPESLKMSECSTPKLIPDGWLVGCDFHAKNKFGGVVKKRAFFVVKHNQVVSYNEL